MVRQSPYSIGYVELIYAVQNKMHFGAVQNAAGKFVKASTDGRHRRRRRRCQEHARRLPRLHHQRPRRGLLPHLQLHLAADPDARRPTRPRARPCRSSSTWMLEHGEAEAASLSYAPLPKPCRTACAQTIKTVK